MEDSTIEFSNAGGATQINRYYPICEDRLRSKVDELIEIVCRQQRYMIETGLLAFGFNMGDRVEGLNELVEELRSEVNGE